MQGAVLERGELRKLDPGTGNDDVRLVSILEAGKSPRSVPRQGHPSMDKRSELGNRQGTGAIQLQVDTLESRQIGRIDGPTIASRQSRKHAPTKVVSGSIH